VSDLRKCFSGKDALITGGLGFIGSNLARALAALDARVTIVDSLIPAYGGNMFNIHGIEDRVTVNISDVRDRSSMNYLVRGRDFIFNLAGQVSHIDSLIDPFTDLEINCRSQLSILEACRWNNPGAKLLFAGTRGQYGKTLGTPVTEEHLMRPTDVNGINKIAGEWYHILYNNIYGIRACSLRLTNTYGPRHHMRTSRQGYLNWFIRLAMDDQVIPIYGDGAQLRDFNFVGDVVQAMLMAMASDETYGQVYNIGGGQPVSVARTAEKVVAVCGSGRIERREFPPEKKKIEIGDYVADFTKFREITGWTPKITLEEGLGLTVDYYRANRERYWSRGDGSDS